MEHPLQQGFIKSKKIPFCAYKIPFCAYKIPFCEYKAIFAFDLLCILLSNWNVWVLREAHRGILGQTAFKNFPLAAFFCSNHFLHFAQTPNLDDPFHLNGQTALKQLRTFRLTSSQCSACENFSLLCIIQCSPCQSCNPSLPALIAPKKWKSLWTLPNFPNLLTTHPLKPGQLWTQ